MYLSQITINLKLFFICSKLFFIFTNILQYIYYEMRCNLNCKNLIYIYIYYYI